MGGGSQRALWVLVYALAASGCTFDTSGVPSTAPADLRLDAPAVDWAARPDLSSEQPVADSHPTADADMMAQDTTRSDTLPADTSPPLDMPPPPDTVPPTCDARYGQAQQYVLCVETSTSCEFFVKSGGDTCTTICASFGGSCLGGYDNSGSCTHVGSSNCNKSLSGQICICSK